MKCSRIWQKMRCEISTRIERQTTERFDYLRIAKRKLCAEEDDICSSSSRATKKRLREHGGTGASRGRMSATWFLLRFGSGQRIIIILAAARSARLLVPRAKQRQRKRLAFLLQCFCERAEGGVFHAFCRGGELLIVDLASAYHEDSPLPSSAPEEVVLDDLHMCPSLVSRSSTHWNFTLEDRFLTVPDMAQTPSVSSLLHVAGGDVVHFMQTVGSTRLPKSFLAEPAEWQGGHAQTAASGNVCELVSARGTYDRCVPICAHLFERTFPV
jgi:hypothetical protein